MPGIDENKYRLSRRTQEEPVEVGTAPPERVYPSGSFFPLIRGVALAVMTLRSYAANCLAVIEWGLNPITGTPLTEAQIEHLRDLGYDTMQLADMWAKEEPHLPD